MATLAPNSPPPATPPFHRRRKSWGRKIERCCCTSLSYFPLTFVYGLTSWAVYVEVNVSFLGDSSIWYAYFNAALGVALYGLANVSYTIAVFTSPGSPLDPRRDLSLASGGGRKKKSGGYEGLPTYEPDPEAEAAAEEAGASTPHGSMTTVTAKSTGQPRYCKKCRSVKPDRAHHCSTCGRCVLKMDHHCPWLATCVGLRNYKPFLLFLIYTSLFCWFCFGVSASWVWAAIIDDTHMDEGLRVVNTILLAVLGGIIGLVLSGFTAWHVYLAVTGQTTIESLEKTRYLSPLRKSMEQQFQSQNRHYVGEDSHDEEQGNQQQGFLDQLKETHANALPGVLRPEEGETPLSRSQTTTPVPPTTLHHPNGTINSGTNSSPAKSSLQRSYASLEHQREQERYDAYLDEQDSEKLPNAFNLGWKRNLLHVLGERPLFWFLPVCNTSGDGWMWEVSPKWTEARARVSREREARRRQAQQWEDGSQQQMAYGNLGTERRDLRWMPGQGFVDPAPVAPGHGGAVRKQQSPIRREHGGGHYLGQGDGGGDGAVYDVQMQPLDRRKASPGPAYHGNGGGDDVDSYDTSSDEDTRRPGQGHHHVGTGTANWNDISGDFLAPKANGSRSKGSRSRSRGRRKGD